MSINGRVYDLTDYMSFHPGGVEELLRGVGKDATFEFEQVHRWVNYETILSSYYIGQLVDEETYQRNKMLLEKQNQNGDEDEDEDELENFQFSNLFFFFSFPSFLIILQFVLITFFFSLFF